MLFSTHEIRRCPDEWRALVELVSPRYPRGWEGEDLATHGACPFTPEEQDALLSFCTRAWRRRVARERLNGEGAIDCVVRLDEEDRRQQLRADCASLASFFDENLRRRTALEERLRCQCVALRALGIEVEAEDVAIEGFDFFTRQRATEIVGIDVDVLFALEV